jgi:hypothetical protein
LLLEDEDEQIFLVVLVVEVVQRGAHTSIRLIVECLEGSVVMQSLLEKPRRRSIREVEEEKVEAIERIANNGSLPLGVHNRSMPEMLMSLVNACREQ